MSAFSKIQKKINRFSDGVAPLGAPLIDTPLFRQPIHKVPNHKISGGVRNKSGAFKKRV